MEPGYYWATHIKSGTRLVVYVGRAVSRIGVAGQLVKKHFPITTARFEIPEKQKTKKSNREARAKESQEISDDGPRKRNAYAGSEILARLLPRE